MKDPHAMGEALGLTDLPVESTGAFTCDTDSADRVLATFQLKSDTDYVLKWVQAAVRAGCSELSVLLHPQGLSVRGKAPHASLTLEPFRDQRLAVLQSIAGDSWLKDLAIGVAVAITRHDCVTVKLRTVKLEWTAGALSVEHVEESDEFSIQVPCVNRDWHYDLSLRERCLFAPIPISWSPFYSNATEWFRRDTGLQWKVHLIERHLPAIGISQSETVAAYQSAAPTMIFTEHEAPVGDRPSPVFIRTHSQVGTRTLRFPDTNRSWRGPFPIVETPVCKAVIAIPAALKGPSLVLFVKGGVTMEPVYMDLGCPGCFCICSGDGLSVDLSQFKVIRNTALDATEQWLREEVLEGLKLVIEHQDRFRPCLLESSYPYYWPILLGVLGGVISGGFGFGVGTAAGVITGLAQKAATSSAVNQKSPLMVNLRRHVKRRLGVLRSLISRS